MCKKFCGLLIVLFVFCGIFAVPPVVNAMMKSTGIVRAPVIPMRELSAVTVTKNGDKWNIKWQYRGLEGTKIKINLYENGELKQTIAEDISIGENGRGTWDWGNNGPWDNRFSRGKEYKVEIVSMTDSGMRTMSEKIPVNQG